MLRPVHKTLLLCALIVLGCAPSALADNVQLSVDSTGLGAALELAPTGRMLSCAGTRCNYEYARGTTVFVTARPVAPSSFARWLGACNHATGTCPVVLDVSKSLTARFSPVALYLQSPSRYDGNVYVSPQGRGCGPSCIAYPYATRVTVRAEAAANHAFAGWFGPPCNTVRGNVCSVTLFNNADVVPRFVCTGSGEEDCLGQVSQPIERNVLTTVRVVGGSGSVQVSGRACTRSCDLPIRRGTVVTLRADGAGFRGWSGSCAGSSPRCQFTAFRDARGNLPRVTATFG